MSSKKNFYDDNTDDENKQYILCGPMLVKSFVIIFNIIFIISGGLLIGFGVWTLTSKQEFVGLLSSILYQTSTYILIVAGGFIILTGILGIISAWSEIKKLIILYIVLLAFVFLIEITVGVLAFAYRVKLTESLKYDLETLILYQYNQPGFEEKSKLFDKLQLKFKCCGATNFLDWRDSKYVSSQNSTSLESKQFNLVAESCCKTPSTYCAKRDHPSNINYQGCVSPLEDYISNHIVLIGVVGLSSFLFQSVGIFLTFLLLRRIEQKKTYESIDTEEK